VSTVFTAAHASLCHLSTATGSLAYSIKIWLVPPHHQSQTTATQRTTQAGAPRRLSLLPPSRLDRPAPTSLDAITNRE